MRCRLHGPPGSVIVKWLRPGTERSDPRQLWTEQAALEFLEQIGFRKAPRLIAAEAGLMILEDLAPRRPLADLLRAQGEAGARAELSAFAQAIGELGAVTASRAAAFDAALARHGQAMEGRERGLGQDWPAACAALGDLGRPMGETARADLAAVAQALHHPGPFLTLSNGDPEANNALVRAGEARIIDFEFAAFRHAATCATWIHVPGPAWMTVASAPVRAELESGYREALSRGVPEAADDLLFGQAMAGACLAVALDRLGRFAKLEARPAGDPSRLQMVSTLESAAGAARDHGSLLALADWTLATAGWLRRRWPDADQDLAVYPAFAPRP